METCREKSCKNKRGGFETKSKKPSSLCKYHYDLQTKSEEKRAKRVRDYKSYEETRKNNPERIAYKKEYGRIHKPWQKYRKRKREENEEEYLRHNAELQYKWRRNNPERWEKIQEKFYNSVQRRLYTMKYSANVRGKEIKVSDEKLIKLLSEKRCFYCGMDWIKTGIDRIINEKDYEDGNMVTCCKTCNIMKNTISLDFFIKICKHISSMQGLSEFEEYYPECFDNYINGVKFHKYKERMNIYSDLTQELFDEITKNNCYLCNKENSDIHHNGIDRVDSKIGYITENMKSCCGRCNYLKNVFVLEDFLNHCFMISLNF